MAASEGQIECLKILLELKADTRVVDNRNQTPLDLARLWGHRTCSKLLSASIWLKDKGDIVNHFSLVRKLKTQDILKEIEQAHVVRFDSKEEAQQKFDTWLSNQGYARTKSAEELSKKKKEKKRPTSASKGHKDILIIESTTPRSKLSRNTLHTTAGAFSSPTQKEIYGSGGDTTAFSDRLPTMSNATSERDFSSRKLKPLKKSNKSKISLHDDWNYSTKAKENDYVANLNDFFPRDPYTKLPENLDLMLLNSELKGMSLDEIKEFMKRKLISNPKAFRQMRDMSTGIVDPSEQRPVYYAPRNIVDAQTKIKHCDEKPPMDVAGFHFGNDINAFPFKEANRFVEKNKSKKSNARATSHGTYYNTDDTLSQIKGLLDTDETRGRPKPKINDEKLEIVKKNFGPDLADFMTDKRHGKMSQKYEKVFIC